MEAINKKAAPIQRAAFCCSLKVLQSSKANFSYELTIKNFFLRNIIKKKAKYH